SRRWRVFLFQAEDGIRGFHVSGVQTCALPIFAASALPVWLLLAPRDYLSAFVKLGVVLLLGIGILFVRPQMELPAITQFVDGTEIGRASCRETAERVQRAGLTG